MPTDVLDLDTAHWLRELGAEGIVRDTAVRTAA